MGRRTAPRYLRVYDKGIEENTHPAGIRWRLELEAKYGLAEALWDDFKRAPDGQTWAYGSLEAQWKSSGCVWPLPACGEARAALKAAERGPASAVQLAAWLRTTVAPTIPRVLTTYTVAELLEILGLEGLAVPAPTRRSDAGT